MEVKPMTSGDESGMVIVYTGHGKGKTTAALGLALRAMGHGFRVSIVQFLKGGFDYGEFKAVERLQPEITIKPMGVGCMGILDDDKPVEDHKEAARRALEESRRTIASGDYDIVVLDEINIAIHLKLITVEDLMHIIKDRPENITLVITGRYADSRVIDAADLVTEMKEIKHPFRKGILSRKGIDH
jgi:cob(I)alamin adenosyltransferase